MKQIAKIAGVTLLEIMLVLAIAALIIVMSVRYFQTASTSQQATAFLSQIQAVAATENNLSGGTGTYPNGSAIQSLITGGLSQPWGGTFSVTGGTAGTFTIIPNNVPAGVCTLLESQLSAGSNWSMTGTSCTSITYSFQTST